MASSVKTFLGLALMLSFAMLSSGCTRHNLPTNDHSEISYSELYAKVTSGDLRDALITDDVLYGHLKSSPQMQFETKLPANHDDLDRAMLAARVNITIKPVSVHSLSPSLVNLIAFFAVIAALLLTVPPYWVIFKKAGFQPILAIIMLLPLVNLIVLYIVAFSKWKGNPPRAI